MVIFPVPSFSLPPYIPVVCPVLFQIKGGKYFPVYNTHFSARYKKSEEAMIRRLIKRFSYWEGTGSEERRHNPNQCRPAQLTCHQFAWWCGEACTCLYTCLTPPSSDKEIHYSTFVKSIGQHQTFARAFRRPQVGWFTLLRT